MKGGVKSFVLREEESEGEVRVRGRGDGRRSIGQNHGCGNRGYKTYIAARTARAARAAGAFVAGAFTHVAQVLCVWLLSGVFYWLEYWLCKLGVVGRGKEKERRRVRGIYAFKKREEGGRALWS
jgi:hypothetical protein